MTQPPNEKPQEKNIFETILARRSVRTYAPNELDHNTVQTLLEAAVRASTAMHEEPWAFVVVQNKTGFEAIVRSRQASFHLDVASPPPDRWTCTRHLLQPGLY
jgi:nitroreductase